MMITFKPKLVVNDKIAKIVNAPLFRIKPMTSALRGYLISCIIHEHTGQTTAKNIKTITHFQFYIGNKQESDLNFHLYLR